MTFAGFLFLAALVGVFAFYMGILSYGLVVAGEEETGPAGAAAQAGNAPDAADAAIARRHDTGSPTKLDKAA